MAVIINDIDLPSGCNECPAYRGWSICLFGGAHELKESASHRQPFCKLRELVECGSCAYEDKGVCRHPYFPPHEVWDGDFCSYGEPRQQE